MNRLDVLICTYGQDGLERVGRMNLAPVDGVGYLVSCQSPHLPLPESLRRDDIRVVFSSTKGLSLNRNNALANADADYVLLCDDDVDVYPESYPHVIEAFDRNPDIEIAAFMVDFPGGKVYPPVEHELWRPYKNYLICSIEIAFRMRIVRNNGLKFNSLWGIGAPFLGAGEESVFLLRAKNAGLKGRFFPVRVGAHPSESTGFRVVPPVLRANGAYICLAYPVTALPRILLKAWRSRPGFFCNLKYLAEGALHALVHRRALLS